MDQEKIGKFIAVLRKEKNMTQEDLGKILNVDRRTVSKWENGNYAPDISLLLSLSETLGVSVNELIHGEWDTKNDDTTAESISFYTKLYKHKFFKIFSAIIIFLFIIFVSFLYFYNYHDYKVTTLSTNTENYEVDGTITYNNERCLFYLTSIMYNDIYIGTDKETDLVSLKASLFINNKRIYVREYEELFTSYNQTNGKYYLNDILDDLSFYYDGEVNIREIEEVAIFLEYIDSDNNEYSDEILLNIN